MKPQGYEDRAFPGRVEIREREEGGAVIRGVAAVYDKRSENLGGFREIIEPGAFKDADMTDVRGLFNHDANFILGRTISETLRLKETKSGLEYEIDTPDNPTIRDLVVDPIRRGDVSQSSFGFIVGPGNDSWDEDDEGVVVRTIHAFREIFDVSPVVFPAYPDTSVGARSMRAWQDEQERIAEDRRKATSEHKRRGDFLDRIAARAQLPRG